MRMITVAFFSETSNKFYFYEMWALSNETDSKLELGGLPTDWSMGFWNLLWGRLQSARELTGREALHVRYEQCHPGTGEADKPTWDLVPVPGTYRLGENVQARGSGP